MAVPELNTYVGLAVAWAHQCSTFFVPPKGHPFADLFPIDGLGCIGRFCCLGGRLDSTVVAK